MRAAFAPGNVGWPGSRTAMEEGSSLYNQYICSYKNDIYVIQATNQQYY